MCEKCCLKLKHEVINKSQIMSVKEIAYSLWQQRGCPEGSSEQDWYEAEKLLANSSSARTEINNEVCLAKMLNPVVCKAKVSNRKDSNHENPNNTKQRNSNKQPKSVATKTQAPKKDKQLSPKQEPASQQEPQQPQQEEPKVTDKQKALAFKEGAKKGQDLSGLEDMGGVHFFHVALENCEGDWELVDKAMEGANTPVDDYAEERKGGAQLIGKAFLSASAERLCIYIHVPENLISFLSIDQWLDALTTASYAKVIQPPYRSHGETGGLFAKAEVVKQPYVPNPDLSVATANVEIFPLKLRDSAIGAGFAFLRSKGLVPENDDSSELEMEDEIEW